MRSLYRILLSGLLLFCFTHLQAQPKRLISFQKIESYSLFQIDSVLDKLGVPSNLIKLVYEVDFYKVLYQTPYLHPDSLVQASGLMLVPKNKPCEAPLALYGHGTQSKRSRAASTLEGGQWQVGMVLASDGVVTCTPDGLGLGDYDPKVPIHPYIHAFSQAYTSINMIRACREVLDSLNVMMNSQVFLYGYSQGGFTTMATHREIQQNHAAEFDLAGSAPMSGPYDLKRSQIDLISSDSVYPTPGYLPFIMFAYQSIYGNLYNHPSEVLKSPYDSLLVQHFFPDDFSIGKINLACTPVPKHMMKDSVFQSFMADTLHPFRQNLKDNHLIDGWAPTGPVKLIYCQGDDQVSYLNSVYAYNAWKGRGAPDLKQIDLGNLDHNACAEVAFLVAKAWFDSLRTDCPVAAEQASPTTTIRVWPNPSTGTFTVKGLFPGDAILVRDLNGRVIRTARSSGDRYLLHLEGEARGLYLLEVRTARSLHLSKLLLK